MPGVAHHLADPAAALATLSSLLRPGGGLLTLGVEAANTCSSLDRAGGGRQGPTCWARGCRGGAIVEEAVDGLLGGDLLPVAHPSTQHVVAGRGTSL